MPSLARFCLLLGSLSALHAASVSESSCETMVYDYSACYFGLSYGSGCKSQVSYVGKNPKAVSCSSVNIFWSYPNNNLTLVIETSFTQARQPFSIRLDQRQLKPVISHACNIAQDKGTELNLNNDVSVVKSDKNYQVVIKFQAYSGPQAYGVNIKYDVLKK